MERTEAPSEVYEAGVALGDHRLAIEDVRQVGKRIGLRQLRLDRWPLTTVQYSIEMGVRCGAHPVKSGSSGSQAAASVQSIQASHSVVGRGRAGWLTRRCHEAVPRSPRRHTRTASARARQAL